MNIHNNKIVIIHPVLWSHYKAKVFSEFYKILEKNGYEFKVIQIALSDEKRLGGVDLALHQYPYDLLFEKNYEEIGNLEKIKKLINKVKEFNPDVLVLPGWNDISCWFILFYARIFTKSKIIVSQESGELDHKRIWYKELLKHIFVKFSKTAFCCGTAQVKYAEKLGFKNIFSTCIAVDNRAIKQFFEIAAKSTYEFKKKGNFKKYNFVYVGRLPKEKNVETLIKAFSKLKQKELNAEEWGLIIVGDGCLRNELESIVKNKNIEGVFFVGGKSWKEVAAFYALSDVSVLPSISEPWGLVVNEAMVCGLPVIVSNRAGASFDLVEKGINGFTFDPFILEDLVNKMSFFVKNPEKIKEMGEKSVKIISAHTPENAAMQMFKGIKSIFLDAP